jgi:hypothetical protein
MGFRHEVLLSMAAGKANDPALRVFRSGAPAQDFRETAR